MHQRGSKTRKFDVIAAALALSVAAPLAAAADWSDTYLFTNYGSAYKFPGTKFDTTPSGDNYRDKDVPVWTIGFQHVSGYKLGTNFFNIEIIRSQGKNDPVHGDYGNQGAQEIFGVYRHTLSLSALSGSKLGGGFVRDFGLVGGINFGAKNNAVNASPFDYVIGPNISFNVPGFWDVGVQLYKETNNNRFNSPTKQSFKSTWLLASAWGIDAGPGKFKGFLSMTGPKGKDTGGVDTKTETLLETFYMFDVGQAMGGSKATWYAGVGFQYWKNKYGTFDGADAPGIPGFIVSKATSTPLARLEGHF